jgi:hypothetical protein
VPDLKRKYGNVRHMIKLQPHQTKFIELNNPKAVLEYQLRNFTCLHEEDTITIEVFGDKFDIDILEIKPVNEYRAICIIDADVDVDLLRSLARRRRTCFRGRDCGSTRSRGATARPRRMCSPARRRSTTRASTASTAESARPPLSGPARPPRSPNPWESGPRNDRQPPT